MEHTPEEILLEASQTIKDFLHLLLELHDEFGTEGFHDIVNPNLDDLEKWAKNFQVVVDNFDTKMDFSLESKRINLAQGLLYAKLMITHVREKNHSEVEFSRKQLERHS